MKKLKDIPTGIYVRGVCISSTAELRNRKDNTGSFVIVREELALKPGLAILERFFDPSKDVEIKTEGEKVTVYPALSEFTVYELHVEKFKSTHEGNMIISRASINEFSDEG